MGPADARLWTAIPQAAGKRSPPHLTRDELIFCMSYKLTRGKFRPLMKLVASNDEAAVVAHSTKALQSLEQCKSGDPPAVAAGIRDALGHFSKLRGVRPPSPPHARLASPRLASLARGAHPPQPSPHARPAFPVS